MASTQAERRERTRKALIEAAIERFSEHGFERTSIAAIARAAGVSKGLVHHYFPQKRDLVAAVVQQRRDDLHTLLSGCPAELEPLARLRWMATAIAADVDAQPERFRLYLRALLDDETRVLAAQITTPGIGSEFVPGLELPPTSWLLLKVGMLGILTQRVTSPHPSPAEPLAQALLDSVLVHD